MRSLFFFSLSLFTLICLAPINKAIAQLNPDSSLGAESSIVNPDVINGLPSDRINGGATRGSNLFHSFQDFNVGAGRGVYFSNPANITNILTRVTGGNPSSIQGVLGVLGNANLFLINPKGISFGPNASLDLRGGSFFGSTADSILFDNFEFSASNPQPVPQLIINIPIGLRFRDNPGNIANNANTFDFGVQSGKTLALVGGNVSLDGGIVYAPGARVELGGLSQAGTVGLNPDGSLSFPDGVARGDVLFTNGAIAYVAASGGGSIAINARNLDLLGGSGLFAGIEAGSNTLSAQAGDIVINATDKLTIRGETNAFSQIINVVDGNLGVTTQGNAGNLFINTGSLEGSGSFFVGSYTNGQGNAGKVAITAKNQVSLSGESGGSVFNNVEQLGEGKGGDISVNADSLSLTNGAQIITTTFGKGDAGFVKVNVTKDAIFDGVSNGSPSGIGSEVAQTGEGNASGIDLSANNLFLKNGARISASTFGQGNAGAVKITAGDILSVDGIGSNNFSTQIASRVEGVLPESIGARKGGDISINAGSLFLTNGGQINSSTSSKGNAGFININVSKDAIFDGVGSNGDPSSVESEVRQTGQGNAGDIELIANNLFLKNGARISASTLGQGNTGAIKITTGDTLSVDGVGSDNISTRIISLVEGVVPESTGNRTGGDISINAGSLFLTNGGQILASTSSNGDAGLININVTKDAIFDGVGSNGLPSGVGSEVNNDVQGNAGGIELSANNLFLKNGARISTSTFGQGNAGAINITARNKLSVDGVGSNNVSTGIFSILRSLSSVSNSNRKGGGISINAGELFLTNSGQINASTFSQGNAGNIQVNVSDGVFIGSGGQLRSDTYGQGDAGNITIEGRDGVLPVVTIDGVDKFNNPSGISTSIGNDPQFGLIGNGKGGDISINARSLSLNNFSIISTATSGQGNAGNVSIKVDDAVKLANLGTIRSNVEAGGEGIGGDIKIDAKSLTLTDGGEIGAVVFRAANGLPPGKGKAGNIVINAKDFIDISGVSSVQLPVPVSFPTVEFSSGIFASAQRGTTATQPQAAGDINITTGNFRIADGGVVDASTWNDGSGGSININAKNFTASGGGQVLTTAHGSGAAGDITLKVADNLTISGSDPNFNQRIEQAQKFGDPTDIVTNEGAQSGIFANTTEGSTGKGGSIFIDPKQVTIKDGGTISATSSGTGEAGNIDIKAGNLTLDKGTIIAESGSATGGNITLDIKDVLLLRRNSLISATAGRNQGAGNGGNININTGLIVALPRENSDIRADAFEGRGGNINIQADAIFGIQPRKFSTPLSDITASSESGVSGDVNLNTLDIDPTQGLSELPENTTDPSSQIAQNPCQKGSGSAFIVTGRGGIPSGPNDGFNSDNVRVDLLQPVTSNDNQNVTNNPVKIQTATKEIIPAQGWVFNEKGEVVLTAYDPTTSGSQRSSKTPASCPAPF